MDASICGLRDFAGIVMVFSARSGASTSNIEELFRAVKMSLVGYSNRYSPILSASQLPS